MRLNRYVLAGLVVIASSSEFTWADEAADYKACLAQATAKMNDACWKQAQNNFGVVSDNSPATQAAIACENSSQIPGSVSDACWKTSFTKHINVDGESPVAPRAPAPNAPPPTSRPTAKTTPAPNVTTPTARPTTPSSTTPQSVDQAQANASADIGTCSGVQNQATTCCNNPMACSSSLQANDQSSLARLQQQMNSGPQAGQSISDYCAQMQNLGVSSSNVNNGFSAVCASNQNSCSSTCSQLAQKYQALSDNCQDCEASSIYESTLATLNSKVAACAQLKTAAISMGSQGISAGGNTGYASACQQAALAQPQSQGLPSAMNAPSTGDLYGCSSNPTSQACGACTVNPNLPACLAIAQGQQRAMGKTGFTDAAKNKEDGSGFDTANLADSLAAVNAKMAMNTDSSGVKVSATVVPNNSGGGIPGSGGAQSPASLGGGRGGGAVHAAENSPADIMHGTSSGGYSPTFADNTPGERFRDLGYGRKGVNGSASDLGIDLKKYLPGGSRDPRRNVAGIGPMNIEINGKGVDLFKKISNKIEEKCKLGILWECKP